MDGQKITLPTADLLIDEMPCGLMIADTRGTILMVNRTFCDVVGKSREGLLGKRLQELLTVGARIFYQTHWIPTLQTQGSVAEVKFDLRHATSCHPMLLNAMRRRRDGAEFDEISLTIAEQRNQYERHLLAARQSADENLQREREAQRLLRASQSRLVQAVRVGALFLWDVDVDSGERRYDDNVAELLGFDGPRTVEESEFQQAIVETDRQGEQDAFFEALTDPARVHSWTCRITARDGSERIVLASGQALIADDGRLSQFVGVLTDVTDASQRRAAAEDRAAFAEQMVGVVSHDLRTPLSATLIASHLLLRDGSLSDHGVTLVERIQEATDRARRLIDELLDFTLVRVGRQLGVLRTSIDLHDVVAHGIEELSLAFPEHRIEHDRSGIGECSADADRIVQLLGNLVANAANYGAPEGPISVVSSIEGGHARLSVHNVGNPIDPGVLDSLFKPMVRGDGEMGIDRSVGLGLFIVKAIADAHGGRMRVMSNRQQGTTFEVRFPAVAVTAATTPIEALSDESLMAMLRASDA